MLTNIDIFFVNKLFFYITLVQVPRVNASMMIYESHSTLKQLNYINKSPKSCPCGRAPITDYIISVLNCDPNTLGKKCGSPMVLSDFFFLYDLYTQLSYL